MLSSLPKHSGVYFINDNIKNLKFKIQFRCVNTLLKLRKYEIPGNFKREFQATKKTEDSPEDDVNVVTIKWQQKLLSPTEFELYSDIKNCSNEQHKKYHQLIKEEQEIKDKKQSKKKRQRKLRINAEKQITEPNKDSKGNVIFTYIQEDNFQTPEDQVTLKTKLQHMEQPYEVMFVYAALKPDTQLAVLKWFNRDHLLYIYPDFTDFHNQPYFIEIDSDYRHLYSYGIKDVSLKQLATKTELEKFLYLPELPTHWRIEEDTCQKFSMPPKRTQRCAILFTINDLSGFEYDKIHVRYHLKLPANTILEEGLLEATTHTAASSNPNSKIHIGWTWQITILCEEQFDPSQNLCIFFEIISIDSWQRERFEGFCYYSLNLIKPHPFHTLQLKCLRPVDSVIESINRYFIGGRRKFDYIQFVCERAKEDNLEDENASTSNIHCRYGVRMQNSGQLSLTCQMLTQRNCELLNPCSNRTSGMTLDDIMMAYKEARQRLEEVSF